MVSVDDLIISLRIDETSNLGKLQKQLTALVGEKGDKKMDLGDISPDIKRELVSIRTELSFISAQTVPDIKDVKALSESLYRDRKTLQRTFDAAADRLISERTDAYQGQLDEYGVENREQLLEKMKETLANFLGMMELGAMEKLPAKIMQNIDAVAKEIISKERLADGDRKTLITKMENAIGELNKMFSKVLTKAGIIHKPEFNLYQIRESWYRKMGLDKDEIGFDMKTLIGSNDEVIVEFNKIKDFIPEGNLYDFISSAFEKLGITPAKEMFTAKGIKDEPGLQALARGILLKAWGTKYGIPTGFHEVIRKILEGMGTSTKEMYEKGRPDFLLINNKLDNLEKIFPPEVAKTLSKVLTFIELKSILSESNKEQFKKYKDMVGEDYLVGVAALVKSSFLDYFPEIKTAIVNIVSKLKELSPEKFMSPEQLEEMSKGRMDLRALEKVDEGFRKEIEGVEKETTGRVAKQGDLSEKNIGDVLDALDNIKVTTDDTNKEVKKNNDEQSSEKYESVD